MNDSNKKIHYVLWIDRHRYFKGIYYPKLYSIEEYGTYNKFKKFQELKDMKTFINKYELKIYLTIKGIKFNKFKIYDEYSYATMISFYDE